MGEQLNKFIDAAESENRQVSGWNTAMSYDGVEDESNSLFLNIAEWGMNEDNGWYAHTSVAADGGESTETGEVHGVEGGRRWRRRKWSGDRGELE